MISELVRKRNVPHYNGGHEMFHDDMIMYAIINDQQSVIAMITRCLHDQIYESYEPMGIHACMNEISKNSFIYA